MRRLIMPSFDMVAKIDISELKNAINQAQKEISTRYDFKGAKVSIELKENSVELIAPDDYKIKAVLDILRTKMAKRNIGMNSLDAQDIKPSGNQTFKQTLLISQGVDKEKGKLINKLIKQSGKKVSSSYMDEKVRITGKKIDDLQEVFQLIKHHKDVNLDLQMENMKS